MKKEEISNVEEELNKNKVEEDEIMSEWNEICCRAPLAGVGEDWVEIVIPHQVSSSASNWTEQRFQIKSSTKFYVVTFSFPNYTVGACFALL